MPVQRENLLFVEQESCLFNKGLLTKVQDLSIETMRVTGTLSPHLRCKLNAVKLNVTELGAIAIFNKGLLQSDRTN